MVEKASADDDIGGSGLCSKEREEFHRLRCEVTQLRQERASFIWPLAIVLEPMAHQWLAIGWAMGNNQRAQLVIDAMNMAITQRKPDTVIHHSDQGSQYTSFSGHTVHWTLC